MVENKPGNQLHRRGFLLGSLALAGAAFIPGCSRESNNMAVIQNSPNFKNGKFNNPLPTIVMKEGTTWDTMKRWFSDSESREPSVEFDFSVTSVNTTPVSPNGLQIMWIGHSTLLIEIDGKRFLTDPMWSHRASPVGFAGPARFFPPPITLDQLPKLDGVIISHDHLDHLDKPTVQKLGATGVVFYMPLGVGRHLTSWGISETQIKELDWWEQIPVGNNHTLISTPARHFSGRGLFDRYETQWCAWVIKGRNHKVFFGGDSGLFPGFKTIGDKYGPFDITCLEIGAYHTNWPDVHLGPHNAVDAHLDLRGQVLLPIHWGLFNLAFHAWDEPAETLLKVAGQKQVSLSLPTPGRYISAPELPTNSYWWRSGSTS